MGTQVNLYEAKTHLSRLVDEAAKGNEIIIAKNDKPVARLVALSNPKRAKKRKLGASNHRFIEVMPREMADAEIAKDFEKQLAVAQYLIDSHIFIWAIDAPERLSVAERKILDTVDNDVAVSVASFWELSIKLAKGMLRAGSGKSVIGRDYFAMQARIAGFSVLPIDAPEAEHVRNLPSIHRDPFDRLIIAQGLLTTRVIITRDAVFGRYPGVRILGAG